MKYYFGALAVFFIGLISLALSPAAQAAKYPACGVVFDPSFEFVVTGGTFPSTAYNRTTYATPANPIRIQFTHLDPGQTYQMQCSLDLSQTIGDSDLIDAKSEPQRPADANGTVTWELTSNTCFSTDASGNATVNESDGHPAYIWLTKVTGPGADTKCTAKEYEIRNQAEGLVCQNLSVRNASGGNSCFAAGETVNWKLQLLDAVGKPFSGAVRVNMTGIVGGQVQGNFTADANGIITGSGQTTNAGDTIKVTVSKNLSAGVGNSTEGICSATSAVPITTDCSQTESEEVVDDLIVNGQTNDSTFDSDTYDLCAKNLPKDSPLMGQCTACAPDGVWTAVGCISTDPKAMVSALVGLGLSIAGGVSILMFLAAGFLFSTSQGDPKRTSDAKELLTSAIVGLLFSLFSVTILQFIGVSVLQIPGFGGS